MSEKMSRSLEVMEIERFAVHDGPGIRTTVFLQGCPMRCPWCANPESQETKKQLMYQKNKCVSCGRCKKACPHGAISWKDGRPRFLRERCVSCGTCVSVCPQEAIRISGMTMTVDEILDVVLRDRDYYETSGGGITISGGEPFVQYEGFLELLQKSRQAGLHTAVETAGSVENERFREAEPYIDLFLFDVKHTDGEKLKRVTGAQPGLVRENLQYAAFAAPGKVVFRVPVVPTFNFDAQELNNIFDLAVRLKVHRVDLLPYHTLGKGKYEQLGGVYPFAVTDMMQKEELEPYRAMGEEKGLAVHIGG